MTNSPNATDTTLVPATARTPRAPAPATFLGALLSVLLVGVGIIGIRDGIVAAGWMDGVMWTANAVNWIDGLQFDAWMIPAGVGALFLGVCLLVIAAAPRRTTAVDLSAKTSVFIARRDVARIAASAAQTVPGVTDARAISKGRTVTVHTQTTGRDAATVKAAVSQVVESALGALATRPRIVVRTRSGSHS